jgi:hypothetical protein
MGEVFAKSEAFQKLQQKQQKIMEVFQEKLAEAITETYCKKEWSALEDFRDTESKLMVLAGLFNFPL